MNKLLIDSRENSDLAELVETHAQKMNIPYEKKWLEIGDYVFDDVCFEAKSAYDFLMSVVNKRLWNQLDNMDRAYMNNIVIVHGDMDSAITEYAKRTMGIKFNRNSIAMFTNKFLGGIGRILLDTDANIILVDNARRAARIITAVCKMKPVDRPVYTPTLIKQKISTGDLRLDVLSSIKGISPAKGTLLLKEFGSIMEIGEATVDEISKLEGFGKVLAQRILDVLNNEDKMVM